MTNHRDAITGEHVTAEHAKTSPDTTVSESRDDLAAELRRLRGVNHTLTVALDGANAKIAELSDLVEVEYAGRMRLAERVRAVRKLHAERPTYDECDCEDTSTPGHRQINDLGLTCNWLWDVCLACCCAGGEYVTEDCAIYHEHAPGHPRCPTIRILDGDPDDDDGHEGGCEPDLEPEPACLIHDTSGEDVRGWEMAECTCPRRDGTGGEDDDANSKPQLGVGLEPIAFDPPLTDDEAGAFLAAITTDEADQ